MSNRVKHNDSSPTSEPERFRYLPWWNNRTKLERTLCIVTVASLLMLVSMVIALAVVFRQHQQKSEDSSDIIFGSERLGSTNYPASSVCLTPGCVKAAAEILSCLDKAVDPCEDFYRFACGGWIDRQQISDDNSMVSALRMVVDEQDHRLRALFEKKSGGSEPPIVKTLKVLYNTCMDMESIEETGAQPLKSVLKDLGGWPVVEGREWDESEFDWVDSLISYRKLGYSHDILLTLSVFLDPRNNTARIISLDQSSVRVPDLNDSASTTAAYFRQMVKAAKLLGAEGETAERELLEALKFELTLADYSWSREERNNKSKLYNKYTVRNLQDLMPQVPWLKYFNGLLNDEINKDETLIVAVPNFVVKFAHLISSTEKRVVANYMMWRVVEESLSLLSKEWRDIAQEYLSVHSGASREKPRWKQCLPDVLGGLGIAISSHYVKNYFQRESKEAAMTLVKYVHEEFLNSLEENDWMDEKTKKEAKDKAKVMKSFVGYPDQLLNDTAVMEVYKNLKMTDESYFDNILTLRKWTTDYIFSRLRKPNVKGDWQEYGSKAAIVNAFARVEENSIEISAGILQGLFFNKDRPHYLNFGAIGFVIGHEMTHNFDDEGRQYDKDGNNANWWDKSSDELFRKKAQCMIDQYSNYTAENGMKLDGLNTLGENIADNGGLKEAFRAYQSWTEDNGLEPMLPGLKYTQNQLFWISTAQVWCAKYRPEKLKYRIIYGKHSPEEFRIKGSMSNLAEFAKEFKCSPDSPMNRRHKCQVW